MNIHCTNYTIVFVLVIVNHISEETDVLHIFLLAQGNIKEYWYFLGKIQKAQSKDLSAT